MPLLTSRTELNEAGNDSDLLHIVDVSDTTDNASGTSKKVTVANLIKTYVEAMTSYFNVSTDTLDDITAGSTNKHFTATDETKLDGIETGAQVNHTTEELQDLIAAMFQGGTHTNASISYNDVDGTIGITASGGTGSTITQEEVEDFVGGLTTQGTGISVNYDDVGNVLTIALTGESYTTAEKSKLAGVPSDLTTQLAAKIPFTTGAGVPSTAPTSVPSVYFDTTNDDYYFATGTTDASDWSISISGGALPKGSILVSDGDKLVNFGVGSDDQVVIADSAQSLGVRWGEQSGGSGTVSNGAGAPSAAPVTLNDVYHDTTNKRVYHAFGTSSVSDWRYTETIA